MSSVTEAVIFLHIPKTAGSTLHHILQRQYRPSQIYHIGSQSDSISRFQQQPETARANVRLLMGHFEMGMDAYLPQTAVYFTMLRHPVARAISYFAHINRDTNHYCHKLVHDNKMDLHRFIQSKADVMMDNGQTRMLAAQLYTVPFGESDENMLAIAKENIRQRVAVVGLTERFDESLLLMQQQFNWKRLYYAQRNKRPIATTNPLSEQSIDAILNINQLDLQLYAYADALLTEKITAQGELFTKKLIHFQKMNQLFSPIVHYVDELHIRLFGVKMI